MTESNLEIVGSLRDAVALATEMSPNRNPQGRELALSLPGPLSVSFVCRDEVCLVKILPDQITEIYLISESSNEATLRHLTTFRDNEAERNILAPQAPRVRIERVIDDLETLSLARRIVLSPHLARTAIMELGRLDEDGEKTKERWKADNDEAIRKYYVDQEAERSWRAGESDRIARVYPRKRGPFNFSPRGRHPRFRDE